MGTLIPPLFGMAGAGDGDEDISETLSHMTHDKCIKEGDNKRASVTTLLWNRLSAILSTVGATNQVEKGHAHHRLDEPSKFNIDHKSSDR